MIMVTGAQGQLASRTLQELAARGTPALGGSRTPAAVQRRLDFDDRASLDLTGVSTLVLVSAGYAEDDRVLARHRAVLGAALRDGVGHVVYTSLTGAGDHLGFALAHRATERLVRDSGLTWTILRNGLYAERSPRGSGTGSSGASAPTSYGCSADRSPWRRRPPPRCGRSGRRSVRNPRGGTVGP
ncbi:NAD(P)H-binding protein [Streptomyces bacillaris]|uniref:NAD(P)H-binding protein n=1 Tax=Streptomyces bacillaris TaxID=68179 RepID=UPI0037F908A0